MSKNLLSLARQTQSRVSNAARAAVVTCLALAFAGAATAAPLDVSTIIDVAEIIQVITAAVVIIGTIGMAILSMMVVIKMFKWVQKVL